MSKVKLVPGLMALLRMAKDRKARIAAAQPASTADPVSAMAHRMHPEALALMIEAVREESESVRTYRLKPRDGAALPVFQAGQYISVKLTVGNSKVSRAYTISSAPYEAEGEAGYYELTIRRKPGGLVSNAIWDMWQPGTAVDATGPHGDFCLNPLRDPDDIVAIAGGAGITPFISMMKQFAKEEPQRSVTLLYGCRDDCDVLFEKEIGALCREYPGRFKRANTFECCAEGTPLRQGYIDADFIRASIEHPETKTYFICGPAVMYRFLRKEFEKLGKLERKQTRYEVSGAPDNVSAYPGFPADLKERVFTATVQDGLASYAIPARSDEPLLVAVERAGLILDSRCRSGECGICRSALKSGDVFILPDSDGRREADRELGYIHPCATYPLSDVTLVIPPGKTAQT